MFRLLPVGKASVKMLKAVGRHIETAMPEKYGRDKLETGLSQPAGENKDSEEETAD